MEKYRIGQHNYYFIILALLIKYKSYCLLYDSFKIIKSFLVNFHIIILAKIFELIDAILKSIILIFKLIVSN